MLKMTSKNLVEVSQKEQGAERKLKLLSFRFCSFKIQYFEKNWQRFKLATLLFIIRYVEHQGKKSKNKNGRQN